MQVKMPALGSMLLVVLAMCLSARGDAIYNDGAEHNLATPLSDTVVLQNCLDMPTTLRVQTGGDVAGVCKALPSGNQAVGVSVTQSTLSVEGGSVTCAGGDRSYGVDSCDGDVTVQAGSVCGGSGTWTAGIRALGGSVCVQGGSVGCGSGVIRDAIAGTAAVTIEGGTITGNVTGASLNVSDGAITGNLKACGGAASVTGGTIVGSVTCGSGPGSIGGGTITGNIIGGAGALDVCAGTITGDLCGGAGTTTLRGSAMLTGDVLGGAGKVSILGGTVKGCVQAGAGGLDIYDGNLQGPGAWWNYGIRAGAGATVNLHGGTVAVNGEGVWNYAILAEGGRVNIYGGNIVFGGTFDDAGWSSALCTIDGTIYLYGTFDRGYGEIWSTYGTISGTLEDGTELMELSFYQYSPGRIVLASPTPEPATLSLLALGATALLRRRSR